MNEIERHKQLVKESNRLFAELQQTFADIQCIYRQIEARKNKRRKRKSN